MLGGGESMAIASVAAWFTPTVLFCIMNLIIGIIFIASKSNTTTTKHHHDHRNSPTPMGRVSSFLERARSVNFSSYTATTATTATITAAVESQHQSSSQPSTPTYSSSSRLAQSIHFCSSNTPPPEFPNRHTPIESAHAPTLFERVKSIKLSSVNESEQISNSPGQLGRAPSFFERVTSFKISSAFTSGAPPTQPENFNTKPGHKTEHQVIKSKSEKTKAKKPPVEMKKSRSEMRIPSDEDEEDLDKRRPATARAVRNVYEDEVDSKADDFITRFKQQLKLQRLESLVRYRDMVNRGT